MQFQGSDTYITLQGDYYLQVIDVENRTNHPEGTKLILDAITDCIISAWN